MNVTEDAFFSFSFFIIKILILTLFPPNLCDVSNGHQEGFHRDMKVIENQYQGKFNPTMTGNSFWYLQRDTDEPFEHKSK